MESFWAGVGAMAAVGALVIAWLRYRATTTGLVAKVEQHQFALPSYLAEGPQLIAERLSWPSFLSDMPGITGEAKLGIRNGIRETIDEVFPRDAQLWGERLRVYWTVDVTNKGSSTAEEVALRVPHATRVRIVREGRDPTELDVSVLIELGSIRPGETLAIQVWGAPFLVSGRDTVQLVQKSGKGKVLRFERVTPFWKAVSENSGFALFVFLIALIVTYLSSQS